MNYNSPSSLKAILEQEGLGMRKKFGQNFLINPKTRLALVDALGSKDVLDNDNVWEIGPGLGAMTALLLEKGFTVKAFEIDPGFIRVLKRVFVQEDKFSLVEGDVLKTWPAHSHVASPYLLGNLPYNIAAVLVADLIEKGCFFKRIVVTVQKEVALRMAARPGSSDYSSFSVLCSSVYKVKPLMVIKPSSFYPQPNVESMGVLLESRREFLDQPASLSAFPSLYFPLIRALFASRRKTIKNNLQSFLSARFGSSETCDLVLGENALSGMERAEQLDQKVFLALAISVQKMHNVV